MITKDYTVNILCDKEAGVWVALGKNIPGLVLEDSSYDTLLERLQSAVPEILEVNQLPEMSQLHYTAEIICKKKVLPGVNTLEVTKSELILEWWDKNERPMSDFLDTAYYKAIWNCPTCKVEYIAPIREREMGDDACPYCNDRKVLHGFNSFEQRHPDLMKEWNWINNYLLADPDEILDRYNEPLWWNCPTCGETYLCSPKKGL